MQCYAVLKPCLWICGVLSDGFASGICGLLCLPVHPQWLCSLQCTHASVFCSPVPLVSASCFSDHFSEVCRFSLLQLVFENSVSFFHYPYSLNCYEFLIIRCFLVHIVVTSMTEVVGFKCCGCVQSTGWWHSSVTWERRPSAVTTSVTFCVVTSGWYLTTRRLQRRSIRRRTSRTSICTSDSSNRPTGTLSRHVSPRLESDVCVCSTAGTLCCFNLPMNSMNGLPASFIAKDTKCDVFWSLKNAEKWVLLTDKKHNAKKCQSAELQFLHPSFFQNTNYFWLIIQNTMHFSDKKCQISIFNKTVYSAELMPNWYQSWVLLPYFKNNTKKALPNCQTKIVISKFL